MTCNMYLAIKLSPSPSRYLARPLRETLKATHGPVLLVNPSGAKDGEPLSVGDLIHANDGDGRERLFIVVSANVATTNDGKNVVASHGDSAWNLSLTVPARTTYIVGEPIAFGNTQAQDAAAAAAAEALAAKDAEIMRLRAMLAAQSNPAPARK